MSDARRALEKLRSAARDGRLDAICDEHHVRLLGAFGSATRDDPTDPHDLDLAVGFKDDALLLDLIGALTDLCRYDEIDLAVIDGAEPVLRARAMVGVPLYERAPGVYANEQMAALSEYWDTAWLRSLDRQALAAGRGAAG